VKSFQSRIEFGACVVEPFQVEVFWVMAPCTVVVGYQRFGGPCCFLLQREVKASRLACGTLVLASFIFRLRCMRTRIARFLFICPHLIHKNVGSIESHAVVSRFQ
jgi:hypothetical protein